MGTCVPMWEWMFPMHSQLHHMHHGNNLCHKSFGMCFPHLGKFNGSMFGNMHSCHVKWSHVGTHPKPNMGKCGHTFHVGTCIMCKCATWVSTWEHAFMCKCATWVSIWEHAFMRKCATCHPTWEFPCSSAWEHTFHVGKCVPMCSQLSHRCHAGTMYIPHMHWCNKCAP
jgi:hypothetical protein